MEKQETCLRENDRVVEAYMSNNLMISGSNLQLQRLLWAYCYLTLPDRFTRYLVFVDQQVFCFDASFYTYHKHEVTICINTSIYMLILIINQAKNLSRVLYYVWTYCVTHRPNPYLVYLIWVGPGNKFPGSCGGGPPQFMSSPRRHYIAHIQWNSISGV